MNELLVNRRKEKYLKIINVVGARPNFMKMTPIIKALDRYPDEVEHLLVHTGQHYDQKMSKAFFENLAVAVFIPP